MTDTQGKLLVAPPNMPDWRFQKSVIYIWKHDVSGANGVIINKKCNHPTFDHICAEGMVKRAREVNTPVFYGGPMLNNLIGILHTKDFQLTSTNTNKHQPLAFTLDRKILEVVAQGGGPKQKMVTMGISSWTAGQLEAELESTPPRLPTMSWLIMPCDEKLIFGPQPVDFWELCVSRAIEHKTKEVSAKFFRD